jgi:hypothetical protein
MSLAGILKEHFSLISIYQVSALLFVIGIVIMVPMFKIMKNVVVEAKS